MPRSRPKRRAAQACFLGLALLAGCRREEAAAPTAVAGAASRTELARVRTAPVERREMVRRLSTTTVVESENEIELLPRRAGVVVSLSAEEGDRVAEGAVLATLDQRETRSGVEDAKVGLREARESVEKAAVAKREAEARVQSSRLRHETAKRDFERNEKAGLISARDLDAMRLERDTSLGLWEEAKLALERAVLDERAAATAVVRSELALARQELEHSYTEVTAPFAGVVARRLVRVGDTVSTAAPAFVLTDPDELRVVFHRPQRELSLFVAAVEPGDGSGPPVRAADVEIEARAEALPGIVVRGTIERVSPSIDPESGAFRVTARLHQPMDAPHRLLPGMLVRLEIVTDRRPDALVVEKRAVRREGEALSVFVIEDGRARRVRVHEGFSDAERVELLPAEEAALAPGDRVVVVGNRDLEDGEEVSDEAAPANEAVPDDLAGDADGASTPAEGPGDARGAAGAADAAGAAGVRDATGDGDAGDGDAGDGDADDAAAAAGDGAPAGS